MSRRLRVLVVLMAYALVATACNGFVGFISASPTGVVIVIISPPVLTRQLPVGPGCPVVAPSTSFQLVVQQPTEDLSVDAVTLRFVDDSGAGGSPMSFPAADMSRVFGSSFVAQGASRGFAFSVPIGCSQPYPTRLLARVTMALRSGRVIESDAEASIK